MIQMCYKNLDNWEAFLITNLKKQEETFTDTLEMLEDERFESEVDYHEHIGFLRSNPCLF
jgi:hypothetical protein